MKEDNNIMIRPMTTKEIAALYHINLCTLRKWLGYYKNEIGEKIGLYYRPAQVRTIIEVLGAPD